MASPAMKKIVEQQKGGAALNGGIHVFLSIFNLQT